MAQMAQEPLWQEPASLCSHASDVGGSIATTRITGMITQMSNGWSMFEEHEVSRIIDALLVAGYQRLPHWCFVHGRTHITLHYLRRGMRMLAPPDV